MAVQATNRQMTAPTYLRHEDHPPDAATLRRWGIVDRRELNKWVGLSEIRVRTYWSAGQACKILERGQIPCKRMCGKPCRWRLGDICLWVDTLWEKYGGPGVWLIGKWGRPYDCHTPWRKGRHPKPPYRSGRPPGRPWGSKASVRRSRERGPDRKKRKFPDRTVKWILGSPEALVAAVEAASVCRVARATGRYPNAVKHQYSKAKGMGL